MTIEELIPLLRLQLRMYDTREELVKHDYDSACNGLLLYSGLDMIIYRYEKETENDA